MSSTSSFPKPQSQSNPAPGAPLAIPYLRRSADLFSKKGTIAQLDLSLVATGIDSTSSDPLGRPPWTASYSTSPCRPILLPKIDGKGSGTGRGQRATERRETEGFEGSLWYAVHTESSTWDSVARWPSAKPSPVTSRSIIVDQFSCFQYIK